MLLIEPLCFQKVKMKTAKGGSAAPLVSENSVLSNCCAFRKRALRQHQSFRRVSFQKIRCYRTAAFQKIRTAKGCSKAPFFSIVVVSEFVAIEPLGFQKMQTAKSSSGEEAGGREREGRGYRGVGRGRQGEGKMGGAGAGAGAGAGGGGGVWNCLNDLIPVPDRII